MFDQIATRVLVLLVLLAAGPVWAHPGHGATGAGQGWLHHLLEPIHALPLLALLLALAVALGSFRRARARSRS